MIPYSNPSSSSTGRVIDAVAAQSGHNELKSQLDQWLKFRLDFIYMALYRKYLEGLERDSENRNSKIFNEFIDKYFN